MCTTLFSLFLSSSYRFALLEIDLLLFSESSLALCVEGLVFYSRLNDAILSATFGFLPHFVKRTKQFLSLNRGYQRNLALPFSTMPWFKRLWRTIPNVYSFLLIDKYIMDHNFESSKQLRESMAWWLVYFCNFKQTCGMHDAMHESFLFENLYESIINLELYAILYRWIIDEIQAIKKDEIRELTTCYSSLIYG